MKDPYGRAKTSRYTPLKDSSPVEDPHINGDVNKTSEFLSFAVDPDEEEKKTKDRIKEAMLNFNKMRQ